MTTKNSPYNLFTPEDFEALINEEISLSDMASEIANEILNDWVNEQPIVYGFENKEGVRAEKNRYFFQSRADKNDNLQARLICIEEL